MKLSHWVLSCALVPPSHGVVVIFNIGALPVIWVGHFGGWAFVRNFYFRSVHLLLIGVVAAESLFGMMCPLTTWEDALRARGGDGVVQTNGFVAAWVHRLLFYDAPAWVFTVAYLLFFFLVMLMWYWVRPQLRRCREQNLGPERQDCRP